jgi:phosphoglycerate dehydrogenase-like enzyme
MRSAVLAPSVTSRPDLLVTHTVAQRTAAELVDRLAASLPDGAVHRASVPAETDELLADVEAVVTGDVTPAQLDAAENLRWIHALSSGVDRYPLDAIEAAGVALTNSAGVHAQPIAEHVLCLMLMFERGVNESVRQQARSVWERVEGGELRGQTVGILGVGAIGTRLAEVCSALGMTVLGTKRDLADAPDAVDELHPADDYHEVLARSDYVAVTCPLTEETRGLIGAEELRVMRRDAVLVNIGRGEIVDEDALTRALQGGRIAGAGLDVFRTEPLPAESPLWDLSNVVITPHMAGSTPHKFDRWVDILVENYEALAEDRVDELRNRVV